MKPLWFNRNNLFLFGVKETKKGYETKMKEIQAHVVTLPSGNRAIISAAKILLDKNGTPQLLSVEISGNLHLIFSQLDGHAPIYAGIDLQNKAGEWESFCELKEARFKAL